MDAGFPTEISAGSSVAAEKSAAVLDLSDTASDYGFSICFGIKKGELKFLWFSRDKIFGQDQNVWLNFR
jgi:hypothetical protein